MKHLKIKSFILFCFLLSACTDSASKKDVNLDLEPQDKIIDVSKLEYLYGDIIPEEILMGDTSNSVPNKSQRITIKNGSNQSVSLNISLEQNEHFKLKVNRCGESLSPQKSCSIQVDFSNKKLFTGQNFSASLQITNEIETILKVNVLNKPDPFSTGIPNLQVEMDQGFEEESPYGHRRIVFKNIGTQTIKGLTFQLPIEYSKRVDRCPTNLLPGESCYMEVAFKDYRRMDPLPGILIASAQNEISVTKSINLLNKAVELIQIVFSPIFSEFPLNSKIEICSGAETVSKTLIDCKNQFGESADLSNCSEFPLPQQTNLSPSGNISLAIENGEKTYTCAEGSMVQTFLSGTCFNLDYLYSPNTSVGTCIMTFPMGTGPYGSGGTLSLGHVTVDSGQTLTLNAQTVYDFQSLTVNEGGVVNLTGVGLVLLGSKGDVTINGTITSAKYSNCSGTFSVQEPRSGPTYSFSIDQEAGGKGGNAQRLAGNEAQVGPASLQVGANQNCGAGGKGGQGSAFVVFPYGAIPGPVGGNGGAKGQHSNHLVIKTKGSILGNGAINLAGTNGTVGLNGLAGEYMNSTQITGQSAGGGGGAGGNGGNLTLLYRNTSTISEANFIGDGGLGRNGGARGGASAQAGASGANGNDGVFTSQQW